MRIAFLFFSIFALFNASAQEQTVIDAAGTDFNPAIAVDLVVQPTDGGPITIFDIFETSSNGLTETTAPTIYIPFRTDDDVVTTNTTNDQFSFFEDRATLPRIDNDQPVEHSVVLRFRLNINITSILDRLHVGIKGEDGDGDFRVLKDLGTIAADTSLSVQDIDMTFICNNTDELDCDDLDKDSAPTGSPKLATLHFFLSADPLSEDTVYSPEANNGVFYNLRFSTTVSSDRLVNVSNIQKGDSQLIIDYNGFVMTDIRAVFGIIESETEGLCAFDGEVDAKNDDDTMQSLGINFSNLVDLNTALVLGQEKFEDLTNGNCYRVRLIQCDFFGFCSFASQSFQNSPEEIEALLKKQACFFFTAGFGREHFIVNYFQEWRNKVLKKFWLGRVFISWYYKTAPQYTPYILKTPWLQKFIQAVAYVLYGVIKAWWLAALFVVLAIVQLARKRKLSSETL